MKHSVTSSEVQTRAPWSLPEATLAYFPNARFVSSDRDLVQGRRLNSRVPKYGLPDLGRYHGG